MANELYHFGIKGQQWGVRRYQNDDGTLTEEGKRRYYSQNPDGTLTTKGRKELRSDLTREQRRYYDSLQTQSHYQKYLEKQITKKGKDPGQAIKEMKVRATVKAAGISAAAFLLALGPYGRSALKSSFKRSFRSLVRNIKNSNVAQKGALFIKQMKNRRAMVKNGAVVLKKSAYSVKDAVTPFGGYLR